MSDISGISFSRLGGDHHRPQSRARADKPRSGERMQPTTRAVGSDEEIVKKPRRGVRRSSQQLGTLPGNFRRSALSTAFFCRPFRGLVEGVAAVPRLAPWAAFLRRSAADLFPPQATRFLVGRSGTLLLFGRKTKSCLLSIPLCPQCPSVVERLCAFPKTGNPQLRTRPADAADSSAILSNSNAVRYIPPRQFSCSYTNISSGEIPATVRVFLWEHS